MFTNAPRPYSTPTTKIILSPQYLADLPLGTLSSYFTLKTPLATPCSCTTSCPNCSHSPSPCVFHDSYARVRFSSAPLPPGGVAGPQEHIPKGKGPGNQERHGSCALDVWKRGDSACRQRKAASGGGGSSGKMSPAGRWERWQGGKSEGASQIWGTGPSPKLLWVREGWMLRSRDPCRRLKNEPKAE